MDRRTFVHTCAAGTLSLAATAFAHTSGPRTVLPFDDNWRFLRGDFPGAEQPDYPDDSWRLLNLPHDWGIEGPFSADNPSGRSGGFAPAGVAWYRKTFNPRANGRAVTIEFDGVYENSTAWINGHRLGLKQYGYSSFHYELTPHLRTRGDNVIAVRVDNSRQPNCRWYSGSGIYRHVRLVETNMVRVRPWGTWVTTPQVNANAAMVRVRTVIRNGGGSVAGCRIETSIVGPDGRTVTETDSSAAIPAGSDHEFDHELGLAAPALWTIEDPALYRANTLVYRDEEVVDNFETPFGIRTAVFDPDRGFLLNGRPVKMKGVCLHHDCGCLGAAVPARAWERRLEILKSIGCNAIRASHNPPAPEFLNLCDRLGFLVIDEAFDKYDLHPKWMPIQWPDNWREDLRAMLQRDRNHPSVVLWSVGNESGPPGDEKLNARIGELVQFVHQEEPTRPATAALIAVLEKGVTHEEKVRRIMSTAAAMDVLSVNYQEQWFEHFRRANPRQSIVSTEAFAYYRGGLDELSEMHERNPWYVVAEHDYAVGQFIWPGIDYLGESIGWPSKGWPAGLIDTCGFVKPMAGFHRAVWKPDEPSVTIAVQHDAIDRDNGPITWHWPRLARHWNFAHAGRDALEVRTFTNCETVELKVNDLSYGIRRTADFPNNTIVWRVEFSAGRVTAIGRDGDREVARDELATAGPPAAIELLPDRSQIWADASDLSHLEIRLLDEAGVLVPNDDRRISFSVTGAGRLAGVDNGDLRSLEPYQGPSRTTFQGRCLAVVQSFNTAGAIQVTARSEELPMASVTIQTA